MSRTGAAAVVGICVAIAAAGPSAAASPEQASRPPAASAEVSVTLVEIPVEVWRGSEPVEGLGAADFEVRERGKALSIVAVEPIDLATPTVATGGATSQPASPLSPAARRHLLLLFDFAFSRIERLAEAVTTSRAMLASDLHPTDLVAIGLYLPKGELSLLLNFTADRAAAGETLDALDALLDGKPVEGDPGGGDALRMTAGSARSLLAQLWLTREQNLPRDMLENITVGAAASQGATREGLRAGFLQANVLAHSGGAIAGEVEEARRGHVVAMVETLGAFGEAVRWVEGRKHLMLFSEGFAVGMGGLNPYSSLNSGSEIIERLDRILAKLRRDGWAVDSIDLQGLHGGGMASEGLFVLSDRTGGTLVEGGQSLASGITSALARSAHGYLLTVQVDVPYDGAYHELDVRVPKAGRVRVQHRGGFFAPIPFREQRDVHRLAQAAVLLGGEEERDELGVDWALVPLHKGTEGDRVGLVVEVPGAAVAGSGGNPGVDVYAYAFDGSGNSAASFARTVQLDRDKAGGRLAAGGLRVHGQLELPPQTQRVRLLVRDRNDGRLSLLTADLAGSSPGAGAAFEMLFLPPAGDPWLVVSGDAAFELHGRRLLPAARASIPTTGQADLLLLGSGFTGQGETVRGRILGADGKPVEGGAFDLLALTPGAGGAPDMLVGRIRTGTLESGEYLLEVRVASGSGPPRAAAVRHFRVVSAREPSDPG